MSETIEKWEKRVDDAEEHAEKVYADEVKRLEKQVEDTDKREGREVKHVEHQVEIDAGFAKHHIDYLKRVIAHEAKKVDRAYDRLAEKQEKGASEKELQRAAEHAVKVESDAEIHLERVLEHVAKHLVRDARAAAKHVVKGLERLGLDEEDLDEKASADADKVAEALNKVIAEAEGSSK